MKTSEKKIICITGLDGTGKNTLIENLKPLRNVHLPRNEKLTDICATSLPIRGCFFWHTP